jgi:hypothetical protein
MHKNQGKNAMADTTMMKGMDMMGSGGMMSPGGMMRGMGMMNMMSPGMMDGLSGCNGMSYDQAENTGPLTKKEAIKRVEDFIYHSNNPNIKVGKLKEKDDGFEVDIVTRDNSLVRKFFIDKETGWIRPVN